MTRTDRNRSAVVKLIESEAAGGSVEFDADEAALAGAFIEDAIGDDDLEVDDTAERKP